MIDVGTIAEIISVYMKHGWILRRVLLSDKLKSALANAGSGIFGGVEITPSQIDGLWFSRPSKGTLEAWELRHINTNPYALIEVMETQIDTDQRSEILNGIETRMRDNLSRKN